MPRWIHLLLLFVMALSIACAPAVEVTQQEAEPPDASEALLESLTSLVDDEMVAGAVGLVARDGDVVFKEAVGYADRASNRAMSTDNLFRIASMAKAVTSVAVMILVEEGHFTLDDAVSRYIPALAGLEVLEVSDDGSAQTSPARSEITIRQLLSHTSGLNYRFLVRDHSLVTTSTPTSPTVWPRPSGICPPRWKG